MHSILAARSNFSIGESILKIERLIELSKAVGAKVVALTDTMSVTGLIDFSKRAQKAEIKPIIGCRLRFVDNVAWRKTKEDKRAPQEYYVTAYVLSEAGLKALYRLLTRAQSEDRFYNVAKLGWRDALRELRKLSSDDIVIASSEAHSVVSHDNAAKLLATAKRYLSASNVFLQLTPVDTPYFDAINKRALALADQLDLPVITLRPALYEPGDFGPAEVMGAIYKNNRLDSMWHNTPAQTDMHPFGMKELAVAAGAAALRLKTRFGITAGARFKEGLLNTAKLAERVSYLWEKQAPSLPVMAPNEFNAVVQLCVEGFKRRFATSVFGHKPTKEELRDVYKPRLAYELEVIKRLGFSGYFLLVEDVVRFAKSSGILVGPGRGSVGGSLVAYLMGITDCDPIRFNLLFERFINPDRIDLPDADLDFMSARRGEVIDYLVEKYGQTRVAGISNFSTLAGASSVRDVSKAFGLPETAYRCTKLMPKKHGAHVPLTEAADEVEEIGIFRDEFGPVWDVALKLEGCLRNYGRHAAGVVVGGEDIVNRAVVERRKDGATINWDKRIVEDQGLIKMDILGLSTLDLINLTMSYIRKRHSKKVDLMRVPLDDEKVLENFAKAMTTGVFQFESGGMRKLLRELGRDGAITFDDITAATALYRPGPMESGMMDSYWKRKQGEEAVEYDHPDMKPILEPTFGVIVYQEQVMQISRTIAGYSAPDADKLRKIMGKKLPEEMKKERGKFVDGCVATIACDPEWAGELFDKIEGFAGYGFNKSHSVEYSLISWQSMWLKTYYPVEFFAAALTLMDEDKLPAILKDAARFDIEVCIPDINMSTGQFEILTDRKLVIPLSRVKQISENVTNAILKARETGPFTSKADLIARVERRKCNVRHIGILEKIGAFASIEPGEPPTNDPSRILDQRELIPGLIVENVPITRDMHADPVTKRALVTLIDEYREELADDGVPVKPGVGKRMKQMVIFDAPSAGDEKLGSFARDASSTTWQCVTNAVSNADMSVVDFYWTGMLKRPKSGKQVSADEIKLYWPYLAREIDLLKPPVIVLLGTSAIRHFFPDFKGKASDQAGKVIYSKEYDTNFVLGFNPGEIYFDPTKQTLLDEVFTVASTLTE